jgi:transposase
LAALPEDHRCPWREEAERLTEEVSALRGTVEKLEGIVGKLTQELESMKRRLLGPKSERMPSVEAELAQGAPVDFLEVKRKRKERAEAKARLDKVETFHPVPQAMRRCPKCGRTDLKPLGDGKRSTVFEYLPARFIQREHIQEVLACACGEHIVTAEVPAKVFEKGRYDASFIAHLITAKCADSIPLYRLEKEYQRLGIPIARSTMTDLFHRAGEELRSVSDRVLHLVASSDVVQADETSMKVQAEEKCRIGFVWTFLTDKLIAYRFSPSRSGETPRQILGGTGGALVVDAYSGYNDVASVEGRTRVGCHAHVRRYFYEALPTAPEAKQALEFILELYRVEHEAKERGIVRTEAHLKLRKEKCPPIREQFKRWLDEQQDKHPPKSPIATAIRYTLNNWEALGRFVEDVRLPLDNNAAESALRRVALGRKNFLFTGNDEAGRNIAGLYSLVATCEANGVNPVAYLADVLMRVQSHPMSRIDELLPTNWGPSG